MPWNYLQKKIDRVNYLIDFVEDPCHAPWTVYAECALKPLGNLTLALLSFGMTDILIGATFPYAAMGPRRLGRNTGPRRRGKAGRYGIPEIGNMIGNHFPGAAEFKARRIAAGAKVLWIGLGIAERILFWWMILDQLSDALYYWATLVNKSEQCQLQRLIGATCCQVQPTGSVREILNPLACSAFEKHWGDIGNDGGIIEFYQPTGITVAAIEVTVWVDEPDRVFTGFDLWIADPADPYIPLSEPSQGVQNPDGTWSGIVKASPGFARPTRAYYMGHGRNSFITGGYLNGWAYKR